MANLCQLPVARRVDGEEVAVPVAMHNTVIDFGPYFRWRRIIWVAAFYSRNPPAGHGVQVHAARLAIARDGVERRLEVVARVVEAGEVRAERFIAVGIRG